MAFSGSVVIVTGAGTGIGESTALKFSEEDAYVALVDIKEDDLKIAGDRCSATGGKNITITADVTKDEDVKKIIEVTIKEFGKLDILVNNAGIYLPSYILQDTFMEIYDKVLSVNLRAVANLTMVAAPHLIKTKGNIVNISSVAGFLLFEVANTVYAISKAGVIHLTKGTALELAASGVRVNAVCPGPVDTKLLKFALNDQLNEEGPFATPLGKISKPDEIAEVVAFLASDKAKSVTGSTYKVDNGLFLK